MNIFNKKRTSTEDEKTKSFTKKKAKEFLAEVPGWELSRDAKKISKEFTFRNFVRAMRFVDKAAQIAEREEHHPDIHIFYDKVVFDLSTHDVNGLSEKDFIMAAKIDKLKAIDIS